MPTITDQAIVIRRWDFSETSQTVSLFTRDHGIVRGLAKGAKREKGDFSGGLDLLTRGEVVAIVKSGRDLATLTAWHLQEMYRPLRMNLHAHRIGLYMADLIHHMLIDHDPHPRMFSVLADSLQALAEQAAHQSALLTMQWTLLGEAGYSPQLEHDAQTGETLPTNTKTLAFSASAGGVIAPSQETGAILPHWKVRRETIALLQSLSRNESISSATPDTLRRANRLVAVYAREVIGAEIPTLRWVFPDLAGKS
jgi:DNA repair protein RecO (recombination protein O)